MVSDAQGSRLGDLFDVEALTAAQRRLAARDAISTMQAATAIYTTTIYALLQHGRNAPALLAQDPATQPFAKILDAAAIAKLGVSYLDLGVDPWGQPYQIFPGPWRRAEGTIPFRTYLDLDFRHDSRPVAVSDTLTVAITTPDGPAAVGYPAHHNRLAFIWSLGKNEQNDQPHYGDPSAYPASPRLRYRDDAKPEELGGGDDVNNWDNTRSFERSYD